MSASETRPLLWLPAITLWRREMVRFFRQKNRVIGALATPIVFWFLIGSGMGNSFSTANTPPGMTYLEYFFPGTLLLILLFTAIFSTISIIEDRREGFLQAVLVAPVSRGSIVLGKLLGGTSVAVLQGLLFYLLAPFAGIPLAWGVLPLLIPVLFLVGLGLTAMGYMIAWPLDSTQGFHAIMNLFLIPLWLLSGALFPAAGAAPWLRAAVHLNPLYYGLTALRGVLYPHPTQIPGQPAVSTAIGVLIGFAVVLFILCTWMTRRRKESA